jgi:hypothetical protein
MSKQFYENRAIKDQAETSDGLVVGLLFEDGSSINIPKWESEFLVTDSEINETDARNLRANYVAGKILEVLLNLDVKMEEVGYYLKKVNDSLFDINFGSFGKMVDWMIRLSSNGVANGQKDLRMQVMDAIMKNCVPKDIVEEKKA